MVQYSLLATYGDVGTCTGTVRSGGYCAGRFIHLYIIRGLYSAVQGHPEVLCKGFVRSTIASQPAHDTSVE